MFSYDWPSAPATSISQNIISLLQQQLPFSLFSSYFAWHKHSVKYPIRKRPALWSKHVLHPEPAWPDGELNVARFSPKVAQKVSKPVLTLKLFFKRGLKSWFIFALLFKQNWREDLLRVWPIWSHCGKKIFLSKKLKFYHVCLVIT